MNRKSRKKMTQKPTYQEGVGGQEVARRARSGHAVLAVALLGFAILNWANGRLGMADFKVYFDAAGDWMQGSSPYGQAYGLSSGYYKYAPVALLPWMLLQPLGWGLSSTLYLFLMLGTMIWALPKFVLHVHRMLRYHQVRLSRPTVWTFVIFALLALQHLSRELLLGNVNWFLLLGIGVWWRNLLRPKHEANHAIWSGLLLAIICVFKPHFGILLPWLGWRRPSRYLIWTATWGIFLLLLPAIWLGMEDNFVLLWDWAGALLDHNTARITSFNTISGLLGLANSGLFSAIPAMVTVGLLIFWIGRDRSVEKHDESLEIMVLVAIIPNLVLTDTEHFMWSFPLLAWWCLLLTSRSFWEQVPIWDRLLTTIVFAIMLIPYSLASPDLWGDKIGSFLEHGGPMGVANLFLIVCGIWMHHVYLTSDL
jgi:hypothetical protein